MKFAVSEPKIPRGTEEFETQFRTTLAIAPYKRYSA